MSQMFTEEFHRQIIQAREQLHEALVAKNPLLIETARARILELGELARQQLEPRPATAT